MYCLSYCFIMIYVSSVVLSMFSHVISALLTSLSFQFFFSSVFFTPSSDSIIVDCFWMADYHQGSMAVFSCHSLHPLLKETTTTFCHMCNRENINVQVRGYYILLSRLHVPVTTNFILFRSQKSNQFFDAVKMHFIQIKVFTTEFH